MRSNHHRPPPRHRSGIHSNHANASGAQHRHREPPTATPSAASGRWAHPRPVWYASRPEPCALAHPRRARAYFRKSGLPRGTAKLFSAVGSLHRRTGLQNTLLSLIINKLHIFLSSYFSVYARGSKIIEHQNTFISKQLETLEW